MSDGLRKTFRVLAATENEAAVKALIPAVDSAHAEIREGAVRAILERRSLVGQHELLCRLHTLDERQKALIAEKPGRLAHGLRDAVLDSDPRVCRNGCEAILWLREYDLMPALINALEDDSNANADLAASTLLRLADLLYDELASPRSRGNLRRDPLVVRRGVTESLELSVRRFVRHKRREVIEACLLLADRENPTLRQILQDPLDPSFVAVIDALLHSERPGVMRLVLSFLDDPHPPSSVMQALGRRSGRKFVKHLLKKIGIEPSAAAAHNLKRVETWSWVRPGEGILEDLDEAEQHSAVKLIMASGMRRLESFKSIEYLARKGLVAGRRAAVEALAQFQGAEANRLGIAALNDPDPLVQAAAVRQIRQRSIPGSLTRLLAMVDSPQPAVREAVHDALSEFRFPRFLAAFDMLEDEVRRSTGALVKKIDLTTVPALTEELLSPVRSRRLRGVAVAVALELERQLEPQLSELLADEDHMVRMEAARALAVCESDETRQALLAILDDTSVLVRQAAQASLEQIAMRSPGPRYQADAPGGSP